MNQAGTPRLPFRVREATPKDNAELLALDRQCVVAASTPMMFDRSPDFFARSRPYPWWRAYVAEGESGLVGVGAVALKSVLVRGQRGAAAYLYDLRVAPAFRRLGVARALGDAIRAHARSFAPVVMYSLVMEGNVPSLMFVQSRGSRPVRPCVLSLIPIPSVSPVEGLGATRLEDPDAAFELLRSTQGDRDLFPFPDAACLRDRIARLDGRGFGGLYGWGATSGLAGCFGLWDYAPIMRMRTLEATPEWAWTAGRELHQVFLMPLGFRTGEGLARSVRLAAGLLRGEEGPAGTARVLAIPHDREDPAYAVLEEFRPIRLGFTMFGVEGAGGQVAAIGANPVCVDPADL
jgi:GNAT superfamily N-acetyltransferase